MKKLIKVSFTFEEKVYELEESLTFYDLKKEIVK